MARATIVDGDSVLLIERRRGSDKGSWALPGGHIDHDETPRTAAARELEEETGMLVKSSDLTIIGDGFLEFDDGETMVSFNYAASVADATGTVEAADDAAAARFWSLEEIQSKEPLLRASGIDQLLLAIDRV